MNIITLESLSDKNIRKEIKIRFDNIDKDLRYLKLSNQMIFIFHKENGYKYKIAKIIDKHKDILIKNKKMLIFTINKAKLSITYIDLEKNLVEEIMKDIEFNVAAILSVYENYKKEEPALLYIDTATLREGFDSLKQITNIKEEKLHVICDLKDYEITDIFEIKESLLFLKDLKKVIKEQFIKLKRGKQDKKIIIIEFIISSFIISSLLGYKFYKYEQKKEAEQKRIEKIKHDKMLELAKIRKMAPKNIQIEYYNNKIIDFILNHINNFSKLTIDNKALFIKRESKSNAPYFLSPLTFSYIDIGNHDSLIFESYDLKKTLNIKNLTKKDLSKINFKKHIKVKLNDFMLNNDNVTFINNGKNNSFRVYSSFKKLKKDLNILRGIEKYKINITIYNIQKKYYNINYIFK